MVTETPCSPIVIVTDLDFDLISFDLNSFFQKSNASQTCSKVIRKHNIIPDFCIQHKNLQ